jgi:protoporphyrinogen oxidase
MTKSGKPIVIIGAGVAGLAAAWRLSHVSPLPIILLEQASHIGGLASTVDFAGMRVDLGSHRLHPGSLREVLDLLRHLLGEDLLRVPRRGQLRLHGRFISYPPSPAGLLQALGPIEAARCGITWLLRHVYQRGSAGVKTATSYESYLRSVVGSRLYDLFYAPYARKVYGTDPNDLSVKAAKKRITTGRPWRFAAELVMKSGRQEGAPRGYFYYPANGFGSIPEAFLNGSRAQSVTVHTGVCVRGLFTTADGINEVAWESTGGIETTRAAAVISTIPVGDLARLIHPTVPEDLLESVAALRWRGIRLLQVAVRSRQCLEGETYYFPEEQYPFGRISEPTQFSRQLGRPIEGTTVNIEVICSPGDPLWSLDEESFLDRITDEMEALGLFTRREVAASRSIRLPVVYPVYAQGFEDRLEQLLGHLESVGNLYSIGRGGMFFHGNVDHSIMMGLQIADHLSCPGASSVGWRKGIPHEQFQLRD